MKKLRYARGRTNISHISELFIIFLIININALITLLIIVNSALNWQNKNRTEKLAKKGNERWRENESELFMFMFAD